MGAIFAKEIGSYYKTMLGYVYSAIFMLLVGFFFTTGNLLTASANFTQIFSNIAFVMIIIMPLLTMRLFSEERKNKSDQLLLTSPVSIPQIVIGKFLSAMVVFLVTLAITLFYVVILTVYGTPSIASTLTSYLGFTLLGACFISVGLFISSLTDNQLIAAVATMGVLFLLWMSDTLSAQISNEFLIGALNLTAVFGHFAPFQLGIISTASITYFVTFILLFLYLTGRVLERRRWK